MDEIPESSSRGRKRHRDQEDTVSQCDELDQPSSLEENLTFSDTLVALRIMRAQFPRLEKVSIQPFVLRSQLYSSIKDRTQVDRELESLRREKVVRTFKLNTGQDDHAVMFLDDYLNQIERVPKRLEEKKQGDLEVFKWTDIRILTSS
ncbi:Serine/threonine-protein kinase 19 [Morella rubra]|uniref:Serine/threonine-protein kinase 19 n=1 Tax=Morella rubra TaxID=262757 RepID=A0A6A1WLM7_9ROSI|nr:Serine/threonine-protein kinase 19 [Morella rubra]